MMDYLTKLGFTCNPYNQTPVANFFASIGEEGPLLVFAGHTDVVPVGDLALWHSNPFTLHEDQGWLYGRGVADMKGSLACMLHMAKRFVSTYPNFPGRLGFLITSGEEGDHYNLGTPYVMDQLAKQGIHINYCIVGEPSSSETIGDVIKVGRRGSLSATIKLAGKQGHVAYPHLADNPIHKLSAILPALTQIEWDEGNDYFPPTSMQITAIQSGGQANNIIPGEISLQMNFRYSTEQTEASIKERVHHLFQEHQLKPIIQWTLSGHPFLTDKGDLLTSCVQTIEQLTQKKPELSTSGGTSDGRFIAPYHVEVVELGLVNATIHQVNEKISLEDLSALEAMYFSICEKLLN